jgi:hypothetical protein
MKLRFIKLSLDLPGVRGANKMNIYFKQFHLSTAICITMAMQILFTIPSVSFCTETLDNQNDYLILIEEARKEIASSKNNFILQHKKDVLLAKLSIIECKIDMDRAVGRAIAIENPFYSSLAMGGIAATEITSNLTSSIHHYNQALEHALKVTHWTDSHPTSLCFLFQILTDYPSQQDKVLLSSSKEILKQWNAREVQKGSSFLALSKATTLISPLEAEKLLFDNALKSNHYWESIEYLATFLTQQLPEKTLKQAQDHYVARKDWPNDRYFLQAVLIEIAKADFSRGFGEIKKMRDLDKDIALVHLAETMLKLNRKEEAQKVVDFIISLNSEFNFTQTSLERLQRKLNKESESIVNTTIITDQIIDDFLQNGNTQKLRSFTKKDSLIFRDKKQIDTFIQKSLPLAESIRDLGYPFHGSPRSETLGILMICSAVVGRPNQVLEISKKINIPEIRVSYLIDAYEHIYPLQSVVSKWPIHFTKQIKVQILDEKTNTNKIDSGDN